MLGLFKVSPSAILKFKTLYDTINFKGFEEFAKAINLFENF